MQGFSASPCTQSCKSGRCTQSSSAWLWCVPPKSQHCRAYRHSLEWSNRHMFHQTSAQTHIFSADVIYIYMHNILQQAVLGVLNPLPVQVGISCQVNTLHMSIIGQEGTAYHQSHIGVLCSWFLGPMQCLTWNATNNTVQLSTQSRCVWYCRCYAGSVAVLAMLKTNSSSWLT